MEILAVVATLIGREPDLIGLSTWYDGPTALTRSGEYFNLNGDTCAVDWGIYKELVGCHMLILSSDGHAAVLRVNDSGYLYNAGLFRRSKVSDFFLPAKSPNATGKEYRVVIDIPRDTYKRIFGNSKTRLIAAWKIPMCESPRIDAGAQPTSSQQP